MATFYTDGSTPTPIETGGMGVTSHGFMVESGISFVEEVNFGSYQDFMNNDVVQGASGTIGLINSAATDAWKSGNFVSTLGKEAQSEKALFNLVRTTKWIGRGANALSIGINGVNFINDPSATTAAHLGVSILAASANALNVVAPGLGTLVSIGITVADASGGFNWLYEWCGERP